MSQFSPGELKRYQWIGGLVAAVGLAAGVLTLIPYPERGFWAEYIEGVHKAGWVAFTFGLVWLALASAHRHTHFFSLRHRMSVEHAMASVAAVIVAVVVAGSVLVPRLPDTPPETLPRDEVVRRRVHKRERNMRLYTVIVLVATGGIIASYPCRKAFGR